MEKSNYVFESPADEARKEADLTRYLDLLESVREDFGKD